MRTEAILGAFFLAVALSFGGATRMRELLRERGVIIVVAGAVVWTAITAATSGHRLLSIDSLVTVVCGAVLFVCVWYASRDIPFTALLVLIPAAVVNTVLASLQEYGIWNPFPTGPNLPQHLTATGLIGNPNDVGAYLVLCAIVLLVVSGHLRGWRRWIGTTAGLIALAGVIVSQTRTAVVALAASLIVIAARRSLKRAMAIGAVVVVSLLIATQMNVPALTRIVRAPRLLMAGRWDVVFSGRMPSFFAAVEMFRDHPILGNGPGTYKFFYMPYRQRLTGKYPGVLLQGSDVNFAETHNDHLQLLAETGLPGYALFIAGCVVLVRVSKRSDGERDERTRLANDLALPLVIALFVLALAFFPLQIAATRHLFLTMAALITGWSRT